VLAIIISTSIYIPFVKMAAKVKILDNLGLEEGEDWCIVVISVKIKISNI